MWWALNYYGHANVKVLNGGWNQWLLEGRPVTLAATKASTSKAFTPRANPDMYASAEHIMEHLEKPGFVVLDVRSDGEWDGSTTRGNKRQGG